MRKLLEGEMLALQMRGQPNTVLYNYGQPFIPKRWADQQNAQKSPDVSPVARLPPQGLPPQAQKKWLAEERQ